MAKSLDELYKIVGVGKIDTTTPREQHMTLIKRAYKKQVLKHHPDKGGNVEKFRSLQSAYEYLRDVIYVEHDQSAIIVDHETVFSDVCTRDVPSWEYYKEADKEEIPTFCFEYAPSNRSKCTASAVNIKKGEIRVGKMNEEYGKYGTFVLLKHFKWDWIFPILETMKIQRKTERQLIDALTFMEGIYICGFTSLSNRDKKIVVKLLKASASMKTTKKRKSESSQEVVAKKSKSTKVTVSSTEIERVNCNETFVVPDVTEENKNRLKGEVVVATGTFPELGGGAGKLLGKRNLQRMVEKFGGSYRETYRKQQVTLVIIGKDSGENKKDNAFKDGVRTMSLHELKVILENSSSKLA